MGPDKRAVSTTPAFEPDPKSGQGARCQSGQQTGRRLAEIAARKHTDDRPYGDEYTAATAIFPRVIGRIGSMSGWFGIHPCALSGRRFT